MTECGCPSSPPLSTPRSRSPAPQHPLGALSPAPQPRGPLRRNPAVLSGAAPRSPLRRSPRGLRRRSSSLPSPPQLLAAAPLRCRQSDMELRFLGRRSFSLHSQWVLLENVGCQF